MTGNPRGQELTNAQKDDSYLASIGIQKEKPTRIDFRWKPRIASHERIIYRST